MITPFHFATHTEERLRAQFEVLDPALGGFVQIMRRMSLVESRATLLFGAHPASGAEFTPHVIFTVSLVPQKDEKTALNCSLVCAEPKMAKNFRLLLSAPEQAETQILKVLEFLQKAFLPLGYTTAAPAPLPVEDPALAVMAAAAPKAAVVAARTVEPTPEGKEVVTLGDKNKYVFEKNPAAGEPVRMRTHDGAYVPDGELPAELRVNDKDAPTP